MTEKPIIMSTPMVQAYLAGEKTQTRRIVKPQPVHRENESVPGHFGTWFHHWNLDSPFNTVADVIKYCPYGGVGGSMWWRETWGVGCRPCPHEGWRDGIEYRADVDGLDEKESLPLYQPEGVPDDFYADYDKVGWRPSIHMYRWASRIVTPITKVRIERLQDISRGDCMDEGCPFPNIAKGPDPRHWYAELWDKLNLNRGHGWHTNPWVWTIEFPRYDDADI